MCCAWLAPIRLLPVVVAFLEPWISLAGIFALAAVAAAARIVSLAQLHRVDGTGIIATSRPADGS